MEKLYFISPITSLYLCRSILKLTLSISAQLCTLRKYVCVTIFLHLQSRSIGGIATHISCISDQLLFIQNDDYMLSKVYLAQTIVANEPKQNYRDIKSEEKSCQKYVPSVPLVIFQAYVFTPNILLCVLQTTSKCKLITS